MFYIWCLCMPPKSKASVNHQIEMSPQRLGAKECPNCKESELNIEIKTIASGTYFVELSCLKCFREAISEVQSRPARAIQEAISRWNSKWPDVSYYIDGDTEGMKWQ